MESKDLILSLFPKLEIASVESLLKLIPLYVSWNQKINVVSRKDIQNLFVNHILHSMFIGKWISFKAGTKVLDLGTGGGFPGIPLAIMFPNVDFTLVDSKKKKWLVTQEIVDEMRLKNVTCRQIRGEEIKESFDFVLARAVAPAAQIIQWTSSLIHGDQRNQVPNGWILLKGGDLRSELTDIPKEYYFEKTPLDSYTDIPFFENKFIIYIQH